MQLFELDYEDAGETVVTGVPGSALHDLRLVLITTDPVLERRVRQHLEARGARIEVVPDWGRASLYRIQGLDPQLVLLDAATDLRGRADATRRLGDDTRLRWATIDRVPRNIDASEGVDRLVEIATVSLGADRHLQADVLLNDAAGFRAPVDAIGPARLLWVLGTGGGAHRVTFEDESVRGVIDIADGFVVQARWVEVGNEREALVGLPAVTALCALRAGEMRIARLETGADLHIDDVGPANDVLARSARPELSWVATRVATGRYLYPPEGVVSKKERDLPEATRRETPSARASMPPGEKPTVEVPVVEVAIGLTSESVPQDLSMPRMPRAVGPKAPVDVILHKPDPNAVKIQTIVRLETHPEPFSEDIDIDIEHEPAHEPEEAARPSYDLFPSTQPPIVAPASELHAPMLPPAPHAHAHVASSWAPAPVSPADTIRPAAPKRRRSVLPWLFAAVVVLGLAGTGAAAHYFVGVDRITTYASDALDELPLDELPLDELPLDELPFDLGVSAPAPTAPAVALADAPRTAPTAIAPVDEVADPTAIPDETMVFELDDEDAAPVVAPESASDDDPGARRRRRARRLMDDARDSSPTDAIALYTEVLSRNGHDARAMMGLAEAHLELGNASEAVHWADRATSARPNDATTWQLFGRALRAAGDETSAEHAFTRARALSPASDPVDTTPAESPEAPAPDASASVTPVPEASPLAPLPPRAEPAPLLPPAI